MPTYVNGNRLDSSWNERFSSRSRSSILQPLDDSGSDIEISDDWRPLDVAAQPDTVSWRK